MHAASQVAIFFFASKLQDPRDFRKALFFEQGTAVGCHMLISAVMYYYTLDLTSPHLPWVPPPQVSDRAEGLASVLQLGLGIQRSRGKRSAVWTTGLGVS